MRTILISFVMLLGACTVESTAPVIQAPPKSQTAVQQQADVAVNRFVAVIERMEPIVEQVCRERKVKNCDFEIVIDSRPNQPPNAFQTLDRRGRPVLGFNTALIGSVRNADELAFVVGHEAAHHIANHLQLQAQSATVGAVIIGSIFSAATGGDATAVRTGQEIGAAVGARSYSKEFELEADALGTIITHRAGYNPVRGAEFFNVLPDPGDRFLGTHPPNADRIATVRRVARRLK